MAFVGAVALGRHTIRHLAGTDGGHRQRGWRREGRWRTSSRCWRTPEEASKQGPRMEPF